MLYGPPGVGKSTFGASAPNPIFIPCERGLDQITVAKFPTPKTLAEFGAYLNAVDTEEHDFESLIIDTADALELLIFDAVCTEGKVKSIEQVGGGYGWGFMRAREYWARLLARLTELSEKMNVLLIAHSHLRTINDPMLATAYDVHEPKIQAKSIELIRQSVDLIIFAHLQTSVIKDGPKARKGRGLIGDDREMFTQPTTGIECQESVQPRKSYGIQLGDFARGDQCLLQQINLCQRTNTKSPLRALSACYRSAIMSP